MPRSDRAPTFVEHFRFLAQTPECATLLTRLSAHVVDTRITGGKRVWKLNDQYERHTIIECEPPYVGDAGKAVPKSVNAVLKVHNGISWDKKGFGFWGINRKNRFGGSGNWEYETLQTAAKENSKFLDGLRRHSLEPRDVVDLIAYGPNWIISNPVENNALGEPAAYFMDHGACVAVPIKEAKKLGFGALLLRVMVKSILGEDLLKAVHS